MDIDINIEENIDGPGCSSGWTYHRINGELNDEKIGYMRLAYIDEETFIDEYPTIFHFLARIKGKVRLKDPVRNNDWYEVVKQLNKSYNYPNYDNGTLGECLEKYEDYIERKTLPHYSEFYHFHVNRVDVDWSEVNKNKRGEGYGEKLYLQAAKWCEKSLDIHLHSATTQSDSAQKLWSKMTKKHGDKIKTVKYIDPRVDKKTKERTRPYFVTDYDRYDKNIITLNNVPERLKINQYLDKIGIANTQNVQKKINQKKCNN